MNQKWSEKTTFQKGMDIIAGIAFMLFIAIVFLSLTGKVLSLITSIVTEVSYRS